MLTCIRSHRRHVTFVLLSCTFVALIHFNILSDAFLQKKQAIQILGRRRGVRYDDYHNEECRQKSNCLLFYSSNKQQEPVEQKWFPRSILYDDDIYNEHSAYVGIEEKSVKLMARLIKQQLAKERSDSESTTSRDDVEDNKAYRMAKGRFIDLTCTERGERALENLFRGEESSREEDDNVIRGAIMALQSLLVYGTQLGLVGSPLQLQRMIAHLDSKGVQDPTALQQRDLKVWDTDSVRRLKHRIDRAPAVQLLAQLQRKRTTQGAFLLLNDLGAWEKHEDLPLLRSGFSLRFLPEEEEAARVAALNKYDPDELLGLRKDLRHLKVFTIDSADTLEIDDGISVETIQKRDGGKTQRIWIHIADADRWAPRNSAVFESARRRTTSLYLPQGSIPMFPNSIGAETMSLKANTDVCALSLGVELNEDGSIEPSSIVFSPSVIHVSYRLTYDDVDEMLEEGIGYREEWELGSLLEFATKRRNYRIANDSSEAWIPNPIPQVSVTTFPTTNTESSNESQSKRVDDDGIGISLTIQVSHNAGTNQTVGAEETGVGGLQEQTATNSNSMHLAVEPASSAFTLVTEIMILAGEAIGRWKIREDKENLVQFTNDGSSCSLLENRLRLPFRSQPKPDVNSRAREKQVMMGLLEYNTGGGYCHAWYARRFFEPVKVTEICSPHSGLGLDCYVQWTSPIRRFGDLQVHATVKRYLRRKRINDLMKKGLKIPSELTSVDLGCAVPQLKCKPLRVEKDGGTVYKYDNSIKQKQQQELDFDIDFREGGGFVGSSRTIQKQSQQYWIFEYIRRLWQDNPTGLMFDAIVLGCIDPGKRLHAIYVYQLGYETRFVSRAGNLQSGTRLKLGVSNISPRAGIVGFVRLNV